MFISVCYVKIMSILTLNQLDGPKEPNPQPVMADDPELRSMSQVSSLVSCHGDRCNRRSRAYAA